MSGAQSRVVFRVANFHTVGHTVVSPQLSPVGRSRTLWQPALRHIEAADRSLPTGCAFILFYLAIMFRSQLGEYFPMTRNDITYFTLNTDYIYCGRKIFCSVTYRNFIFCNSRNSLKYFTTDAKKEV